MPRTDTARKLTVNAISWEMQAQIQLQNWILNRSPNPL